jgi:hypothetical protein
MLRIARTQLVSTACHVPHDRVDDPVGPGAESGTYILLTLFGGFSRVKLHEKYAHSFDKSPPGCSSPRLISASATNRKWMVGSSACISWRPCRRSAVLFPAASSRPALRRVRRGAGSRPGTHPRPPGTSARAEHRQRVRPLSSDPDPFPRTPEAGDEAWRPPVRSRPGSDEAGRPADPAGPLGPQRPTVGRVRSVGSR